jgi:hypothetical protein
VVTAPNNSGEPINSVKVEPSPATEHGTAPASGSLNEDKVITANHPPVASEPAKKNEKAARKTENGKKNSAASDDEETPGTNEQNLRMRPAPGVPNAPEVYAPNMSQQEQRQLQRQLKIKSDKYPDGTEVTVFADGTRVVTMPNGTKRIIRPGQRVFRRRTTP